ncbi:MAG TPA: hypothetical protein VF496_06935 [Candidatus Deferrimicrobium sp.]
MNAFTRRIPETFSCSAAFIEASDSWTRRCRRWKARPYSRERYTTAGAISSDTPVSIGLIRSMKPTASSHEITVPMRVRSPGPRKSHTAERSFVRRDITSPVGVAWKKRIGRRTTWEKRRRRTSCSTSRAATNRERREKYRKTAYRIEKRIMSPTARSRRPPPGGPPPCAAETASTASRVIQGTRRPKTLETRRPKVHRAYTRRRMARCGRRVSSSRMA